MVRFLRGTFTNDQIRQARREFRANGGDVRELRGSVLRGDSLQNINKILKKSGVDMNLSQTRSYISGSYALSTFVNYITKAQAKNNIRNGLGLSQLVRDGYRGIGRFTVQGIDKNGKVVYRNVDATVSGYDNLTDLFNDVQRDIDEKLFDSLDISKNFKIVDFKFV